MREIKLNNSDMVTLVDDEDYDRIIMEKGWYFNQGYIKKSSFGCKIWLHKFILNYEGSLDVDHIDRNSLNNQKSNLRICTRSQNNMNRAGKKTCRSTPYKGVFLRKGRKYYAVQIVVNKKTYGMEGFNCPHKAALYYNKLAIKFHGEFAYLNIIQKQ